MAKNNVIEALEKLEGWKKNGERISKQFEFETFLDGVDFINKLAVFAEGVQHHPDIKIGYKKILVQWTTHHKGELTMMDIRGARAAEHYYKMY